MACHRDPRPAEGRLTLACSSLRVLDARHGYEDVERVESRGGEKEKELGHAKDPKYAQNRRSWSWQALQF